MISLSCRIMNFGFLTGHKSRWVEEGSASSEFAATLVEEPVSEAVPGWCEVPSTSFNFVLD